MKKTLLSLIVALFALSTQAQQKIGHINSVDVLTVMPEFKTMQDELQKQKDLFTRQLETMYQDYDKQQKDYAQAVQEKQPDAILESKLQGLQQAQQRISDFEDRVNNDLQKMQGDKMKPINDKYLKAVKDVATAGGYAYILDVVSGALAYFPEGTNDVTDLVIKKLGITPPAPGSNTGTTPPKTGGQ